MHSTHQERRGVGVGVGEVEVKGGRDIVLFLLRNSA